MAWQCSKCGIALAGKEFCGDCGGAAREVVERAEAVAEYESILSEFASDGVLEGWELDELGRLREELGVSAATHARLIAKHQPNYATAIAAYNEKRGIWDNLTLEMLARPLDDDHVAAGSSDAVLKARRMKIDEQVGYWYRALAYEKRNTQHLEASQLTERVRLVYRQALNCLRFLPDMWYVNAYLRVCGSSVSAVCVCVVNDSIMGVWLGTMACH